jgi:hypothetical protein
LLQFVRICQEFGFRLAANVNLFPPNSGRSTTQGTPRPLRVEL